MNACETKKKFQLKSQDILPMLQLFSQRTGIAVILVGGIVLLDWLFHLPIVTGIVPGMPTMKANTAVCFILAGISLWLWHQAQQISSVTLKKRLKIGAQAIASLVIFTSLMTLIQYSFHINLGIDKLLMQQSVPPGSQSIPGHMAPNTAVAFLNVGFALLILNTRFPKHKLLQIFAGIAWFISYLGLIGYLYQLFFLYATGLYGEMGMAIHTAFCFLLISSGILCACPNKGIMPLIASKSVGSQVARRLLPIALVVPPLIEALCVTGYRFSFYTKEMETALASVLNTIVLSGIVLRNTLTLNKTDSLRLQAESTLERVSERLRLWNILDASLNEIYIFNAHTLQFQYVNAGALRHLGYTLEQMQEMTPVGIAPELDEKSFRELIAPLLKHEQEKLEFETIHRCANGSLYIAEIHLQLIENDGEALFLAVVLDITEWKATQKALETNRQRLQAIAEEALKASRARLAGILDIAEDAIISVDSTQKITLFNQGAENIFGYTASEVLGQSLSLLMPQRYAHRHHHHVNKYAQTNNGARKMGERSEVWGRRKDGTEFPAEASISQLVIDGEKSFTTILRDITDRKQAEVELRYSASLFRTNFEQSVIGISHIALDGRILRVNQKFCDILSYTNLELLELTFTDITHPEEREIYLQQVRQLLAFSINNFSAETRYLCKDGEVIWASLQVSLVFKLTGEPEYFIAVIDDISKRKKAEAELQKANVQLSNWVAELEQRNQEIALLGEMSDILQACLTIEEAHEAVSQLVQPLFPDVSGGVFVMNSSKCLVEAVATWGADRFTSKTLFTPNECWGLRRGRVYRIEDTHRNIRCNHINHISCQAESLCVPMMAQGEAMGILYLISQKQGLLTTAKQQLAVTVAEHVALALANLKLREALQQQSIRDALTGLFNRRYLEESLERDIQRAFRKQHSLGVIMIDVDHFKRYNDMFGHEGGDTVLRELGTFLKKNLRGSDIACRYGGEEITLILPEASLEVAIARAEQIREGVKHLVLKNRNQLLGAITLSLGVACFPEHGSTGQAVIQAADAALYRAKKEGRDRVVSAVSQV